ncbi:MAG: GNAT family N-acetyltransferase [Deltaproteobacteria bacterium]
MSTYQLLEDRHIDRLIEVMAYTFNVDTEMAEGWLERAGRDTLRVIATGSDVEACLLRIPQGIWFGGRTLDNCGVAGVGVTAAHRGRGLAKQLMVGLCRELHEEGVPVSTLYPATVGLYRRVGYGLAGDLFAVRAKTDGLRRFESKASLREATDADVPAMKALEARVRRDDGNLLRGPYVWSRIFSPRFERTERFVVEEDGALVGYTVFKKTASGVLHDFELTDLVATTPDAHRRLLDFFFTHRSFVKELTWAAPPSDPFLGLWPEHHYEVKLDMTWMLRLTHVAKALEARGYPEGARGALTFEVEDEHVPGNAGVYTLHVEDGRASVSRYRGEHVVRTDACSLATLFSGYRSATALRAMGGLSASDAAITRAEQLFVPRGPHMNHLF